MRKLVRVKGRLESITVSDPTATMDDANETKQMTLKDYMYPTRSTPTFLYHLASPYGKFRD